MITKAEIMHNVQANAVRNGDPEHTTAAVAQILHELEHVLGHGERMPRTLGMLLVAVGGLVFSERSTTPIAP